MCREVDGGIEWAKIRDALNGGLDKAGAAAETPDPDTWGLLPEHIEGQDRILRRGGNVGDR